MARIAVTGAGMGAMTAAARLAAGGHQVTLYERGDTHGGAVRRYTRDGYGFDTGPGLLSMPAVYRDLFVKTGRQALEACVGLSQLEPGARHLFADGTALVLPSASRARTLRALDNALGEGAGARWSALLSRARETWEVVRRPLLEEPLTAWSPLPDPYPAVRRSGLLRRTVPTLAQVARHELRDPRLRALLGSYALAHGLDPRRAPASAAVLPYLELTFGTWYVAGGMRALADAVHRRGVACGARFVFGAEVVRVREEEGRAVGVELADGTVTEADAVIWAGGPPPETAGAAAGDPRDGRAVVPTARFTVLLALRGARPATVEHRTVVHSPDLDAELSALFGGALCPVPTVTVLRPDDPVLRPGPRDEAVTLTVTVPPDGPVDWTAPGLAEDYADRVIAAVDAAGLGLGERVRWREVRTPAHLAEQTGAPGGVVPGPALAGAGGAFLPAANRGRPRGLYRAGSFAHPGGGLAHTGMSGALAAGLVTEGDDWRGSS